MREIPTHAFDYRADTALPTTPMQALMEAAPGENVAASSIEEHPLGGVLDELLLQLPERDRDILVMHVGGFSVREIAEMLDMSKTTVHRVLPGLLEKLAELLQNNPEVMEYMNGPRTTE